MTRGSTSTSTLLMDAHAPHHRLGQRHATPPPAFDMTPSDEATVDKLLGDTRAFVGDVVTQKQGVLVHEVVLTLTQHPAVMPAVMGAMIAAQRRVKDELLDAVACQQKAQLTRLLQDVRRDQPSVVTQLMAACFTNRDGLVNWVPDALHRRAAVLLVDAFHGYLVDERGNDCRSVFEQLLGVYMSALGMGSYPEELSQRIAELKHFLLPHNHTLDRNTATLRHQLIWGCHGIRNIGNTKSHIAAKLTPDEQLEICAAVSALARTLPLVAESLQVTESRPISPTLPPPSSQQVSFPPAPATTPSPPPGLGTVSWSTGSTLSGMHTATRASPPLPPAAPPLPPPLPTAPEPHAPVEVYPPLPPASKREAVPSSPWSQSSTASSSSSAMAQDTVSPIVTQMKSLEVLDPAPSSSGSTASNSSSSSAAAPVEPTPTTTSTVVFADPKRVYKMYYDRPESLPPWSDAKVKMLYARMRNHMHQVPKANLCHYLHCHVPHCQKSHSYLECMSYNPIFKLLKCGNKDHYWGFQVDEVADCACAHVDLEISTEWMDRAKFQLCTHGSRCSIRRCQKSHSVEEIKWYNPRFRTDRCQYQMRCVNKATCPYYHSDEDKRDIRLEDDYVGKPGKILFIERTHDALAKALDALRRQNTQA